MFLKEAMSYREKFLTESNSGFLDAIFISIENYWFGKGKNFMDSNKIKLDKSMIHKFLFVLEQKKK